MLLVLAFRLAKLTAPDKLWQNIIILQPLSLPFIDPLSGGYQLNQYKGLTKIFYGLEYKYKKIPRGGAFLFKKASKKYG
jgi:hypothetical protein